MYINIRKKQPKNAERFINRRTKDIKLKLGGVSASGGKLPEAPDVVGLMAHANDGEDLSSSTRYMIAFNLDDDPELIDALIGKLTDLRSNMRDRDLAKLARQLAEEP